jgi:hypothetical protein
MGAFHSRFARLPAAIAAVLLTACSSIGPASVTRDRFQYTDEIARSWKEQTLLNIVKARYADVPVFLDIGQIVSGYSLQGGVTATGTAGLKAFTDSLLSFGAQGSWTDRPTITYTPLTGAQFNRNMMTPITPSAVLFVIEAGWPADLVFRLTVKSINGLNDEPPTADKYDRVATLMRQLQLAQAFSMRVQGDPKALQSVVFIFQNRNLSPESARQIQELQTLLGLALTKHEVTVTFGVVQAKDDEIALQTRSILQVLLTLGGNVDVPPADASEGRALPGKPLRGDGVGRMRIRYAPDQPADALVRVPYRGGWFWIDDRDLESKRTFALTMLLSTLTETGAREALPLVTISSQ